MKKNQDILTYIFNLFIPHKSNIVSYLVAFPDLIQHFFVTNSVEILKLLHAICASYA